MFFIFSIRSSGSFDILYTSIITVVYRFFWSWDLPHSHTACAPEYFRVVEFPRFRSIRLCFGPRRIENVLFIFKRVIQKMKTEIRTSTLILNRRNLINFYLSFLLSRTQRQSVFEVRRFRLREKFGSNDLLRPGPVTDLTPRLRNGVRVLAT